MVLLTSHEIVPLDNRCIYIEEGRLAVESEIATRYVENIPENAIQQIAVGFAEDKSFIEFEDARLVMEAEDDA